MGELLEILSTSNLTIRRERFAAWAFEVVKRAPALTYGTGRLLQPHERESVANDVVTEFAATDSVGELTAIRGLTANKDSA